MLEKKLQAHMEKVTQEEVNKFSGQIKVTLGGNDGTPD